MKSRLNEGTLIDRRFEIERLIGEGGMGLVYLAKDLKLTRPVAIKVLRDHLSHHAGLKRFAHEARVTSKLRHPAIVQLIDFVDHDGIPCMILEYCPGKSLADVLAKEAVLTPERTVHLVGLIANGLGAAHAKHVVHRDLKPSNLMVLPPQSPRGQEEAKILDFGISKIRLQGGLLQSESEQFTREGELIGTPAYMAPEQLRRDGEVDERADQFALAAMAYRMLTGRSPFSGDSTRRVLQSVLEDEPSPLTSLRPDLPPLVDTVIRTALSKDREHRFAHIEEFAEELRRTLRFAAAPVSGITVARPATLAAPLPVVRRSRLQWSGRRLEAAALLGLAIAATAVMYWRGRAETSQRAQANRAALSSAVVPQRLAQEPAGARGGLEPSTRSAPAGALAEAPETKTLKKPSPSARPRRTTPPAKSPAAALQERAQQLNGQNKYEEALSLLVQAYNLSHDPRLHLPIGEMHWKLGHLPEALASFDRVLGDIDRDDPAAANMRALASYHKKRIGEQLQGSPSGARQVGVAKPPPAPWSFANPDWSSGRPAVPKGAR